MSKRTDTLMVLPWKGGLVTSSDDALLQPSQLTIADNISLAYSDEKRRREGINYNWARSLSTDGRYSHVVFERIGL